MSDPRRTEVVGDILKPCAYLVRKATGLDDHEPVLLTAGAENIRRLILNALDEHDELCTRVKELEEALEEIDANPAVYADVIRRTQRSAQESERG